MVLPNGDPIVTIPEEPTPKHREKFSLHEPIENMHTLVTKLREGDLEEFLDQVSKHMDYMQYEVRRTARRIDALVDQLHVIGVKVKNRDVPGEDYTKEET